MWTFCKTVVDQRNSMWPSKIVQPSAIILQVSENSTTDQNSNLKNCTAKQLQLLHIFKKTALIQPRTSHVKFLESGSYYLNTYGKRKTTNINTQISENSARSRQSSRWQPLARKLQSDRPVRRNNERQFAARKTHLSNSSARQTHIRWRWLIPRLFFACITTICA